MAYVKLKENIPQGWQRVKLKDACLIKKGQQLNKFDMQEDAEYPALNGGISPSGYTKNWNTEANTITISEGGNSCGYVNFMPGRFWSGGHCYSLLELSRKVDNIFLYQILKAHQKALMGLRVGSGLPNIQKKSLEEFILTIPTFPEQQKIAEILSTVDEEIKKTDEILTATEKLKRGLMQQLFTRGIGHTKFKKTKIGEIPLDWEVGGFINLIDSSDRNAIKPGPFGSSLKKSFYTKQGFKIYGQEQVISGDIHFGNYFIDKSKYKELEAFKVQSGDILISLVGTIGKILIVPEVFEPGIINPRLLKITPDKKKTSSEFINYLLNSDLVLAQLKKGSHGGTMDILNKTILNSLSFGIPKKGEQDNIVDILSLVDNKILINKKVKDKLTQLKKGLMQDLLSGRVRVKV